MEPVYVMGVDPGMANVGITVIKLVDPMSPPQAMEARVLHTEKASKKELRSTRMAGDDQRRMLEQWRALGELADQYKPLVVLGVEAYSPWAGRMGGNAWKVGLAYQLVCCFAWSRGVQPFVFTSGDLKRIMTPARAIAAGADYLVVGRPVMEAADPKASAEAIQAEIAQALG
jgi:orotidine-5'-phosphate decarboxylase